MGLIEIRGRFTRSHDQRKRRFSQIVGIARGGIDPELVIKICSSSIMIGDDKTSLWISDSIEVIIPERLCKLIRKCRVLRHTDHETRCTIRRGLNNHGLLTKKSCLRLGGSLSIVIVLVTGYRA